MPDAGVGRATFSQPDCLSYQHEKPASLFILAMIVTALAACSKPASTAYLNRNDFGVIDASSSKPTSHTLADGRVCTITPTVLADGNVRLATTVVGTNGVKQTRTLVFEAPGSVSDRTLAFGLDEDTVITVKLHLAK